MVVQWVFSGLAFALTTLLAVWALDREPPTIQLRETILNPVTAPGEILKVEYEVYRKRVCSVTLEQVLFDAARVRYVLPTESLAVSPGGIGQEIFAIPIPIPATFSQGTGRYRAIRAYLCNPLQHWLNWPVVVISPDVAFEVKGPAVAPAFDVKQLGVQ